MKTTVEDDELCVSHQRDTLSVRQNLRLPSNYTRLSRSSSYLAFRPLASNPTTGDAPVQYAGG